MWIGGRFSLLLASFLITVIYDSISLYFDLNERRKLISFNICLFFVTRMVDGTSIKVDEWVSLLFLHESTTNTYVFLKNKCLNKPLKEDDPEIYHLIQQEKNRQYSCLELIASEVHSSFMLLYDLF